jgi:hypothetical protein
MIYGTIRYFSAPNDKIVYGSGKRPKPPSDFRPNHPILLGSRRTESVSLQ